MAVRDYQALLETPMEELIADFNEATQHTQAGVSYYLSAIDHRQARNHRQVVRRLTWAIAVLTLTNVVLVAATVL